ADAPPVFEGIPVSATPVTIGLIVANILAFAAVTLALGTTTQTWALARAGAHYGAAVDAGEWWRLVSCAFLHVGALHLGVNMFGLWQLGRMIGPAVGSLRTGAIYAVAGIGGSLATHFFGRVGLSAGASGIVFGVLGATIVELWLRRSGRQ